MKSRVHRTATAALALSALLAVPSLAQASQDEMQRDIEALKQGQRDIQKQLAEIKKLLQARQAPAAPRGTNVAGKVFNLGDNLIVGEQTAKLTLVEFTDYQ
jgi:protein-disulfide isomerase